MLGELTPAQRRAMTFEEFWPIFQRHHRVEPNTMQNYFGTWIRHVRPYLKAERVATFDSARAIQCFTWLAEAQRT